jgi:hypothetical protein
MVVFDVDRDALNQRLGNTPNVAAVDALQELLGQLFDDRSSGGTFELLLAEKDEDAPHS